MGLKSVNLRLVKKREVLLEIRVESYSLPLSRDLRERCEGQE